MAVMRFRVGASNIAVVRRAANWFARTIELHAHPSSTGEYRRAIVYFYGPEVSWPLDQVGYVQGSGGTALVVAMLPLADFDDYCRLLQGVGPVYLSWEAGADDRLVWLSLATDSAPVGQGIAGYEPPAFPAAGGGRPAQPG